MAKDGLWTRHPSAEALGVAVGGRKDELWQGVVEWRRSGNRSEPRESVALPCRRAGNARRETLQRVRWLLKPEWAV